jgi:hypothetical protein
MDGHLFHLSHKVNDVTAITTVAKAFPDVSLEIY